MLLLRKDAENKRLAGPILHRYERGNWSRWWRMGCFCVSDEDVFEIRYNGKTYKSCVTGASTHPNYDIEYCACITLITRVENENKLIQFAKF